MVADDRAGLAARFRSAQAPSTRSSQNPQLELDIPSAIWLFATVGSAYYAVQAWRNRNKPQSVWWEGTTAPTEIPADDVRSALASTDDRIPAIKALRELHPGLGLKDAMDLIDAQRGEQGPHH